MEQIEEGKPSRKAATGCCSAGGTNVDRVYRRSTGTVSLLLGATRGAANAK
jgi:hypothetical protein